MLELSEERSKAFIELRIWADTFNQLQMNRIAIENRLRADAVFPDVVDEIKDSLAYQEKLIAKAMKKSFKRAAPEMVPWLKSDASVGLGEHLVARLLGTIGHPRIAQPHQWVGEGETRELVALEPFERNVGKLWAYCGIGDPTRRRFKGMDQYDLAAMGNPKAKTILYLLAISCVRQTGARAASVSDPATSDTTNNPAIGTDTSSVLDPATLDIPAELAYGTDTLTEVDLRPPDVDLSGDSLLAETAKENLKRAHSATRRRSPYRDHYEAMRLKYAEREDWTNAHQHNAALRYVAKQIAKDIWLVMDK